VDKATKKGMGMRRTLISWLLALCGLLPADVRADEHPPEAIEFFEKEVRPLLAKSCWQCHGDVKPKAKLRGAPPTDHFGKECLLARRLVENGVRFVQIFDTLGGNFQPWDLHGNHNAGLRSCAHVHDLHATILPLLGLDHERLTYRYAGRDFRLTDVSGEVVRAILG
jgi:hypothetical protein